MLTLPRRAGNGKAPERDFDVGMVLSDPFEDGGGFFKGGDDEQMLGLGTPAHGE